MQPKISYLTVLLTLATIFCSAPTPCRADETLNVNWTGRVFQSSRQSFNAQLDLSLEELIISSSGRRRRRIKLKQYILENSDFFISDDGDLVVVLLKSNFYSGAFGLADDLPDSHGVIIFRNEKLIAEFSWKTLIEKTEFVSRSISHAKWLISHSIDFNKKIFAITTKSYLIYQFDLTTGKIASKKYIPEYENADYIVEGEIIQPSYAEQIAGKIGVFLEVTRWIKGQGPMKIQLAPKASGFDTKELGTFILRKQGDHWKSLGKMQGT
jgi:hypothetical protein